MSEWTLERALKLALKKEEESIELYTHAQTKILKSGSVKFLKQLVKEEEKHKSKILDALREPKKIEEIGHLAVKIEDLKIVDYLKDVSLSPEADYQQILVFAGKREKAAHDFYMELAAKFRSDTIGKMFIKLAQEELKHKHRIEVEYDDVVLEYM